MNKKEWQAAIQAAVLAGDSDTLAELHDGRFSMEDSPLTKITNVLAKLETPKRKERTELDRAFAYLDGQRGMAIPLYKHIERVLAMKGLNSRQPWSPDITFRSQSCGPRYDLDSANDTERSTVYELVIGASRFRFRDHSEEILTRGTKYAALSWARVQEMEPTYVVHEGDLIIYCKDTGRNLIHITVIGLYEEEAV